MFLLRAFLLLAITVINSYAMEFDNDFTDKYDVFLYADSDCELTCNNQQQPFELTTRAVYLYDREKIKQYMPEALGQYRDMKVFKSIENLLPDAVIECDIFPSDEVLKQQVHPNNIDSYNVRRKQFIKDKKDEGYDFIPYSSKYFGKNSYLIIETGLLK